MLSTFCFVFVFFFNWMADIVNFTLLGTGYFCIPMNMSIFLELVLGHSCIKSFISLTLAFKVC